MNTLQLIQTIAAVVAVLSPFVVGIVTCILRLSQHHDRLNSHEKTLDDLKRESAAQSTFANNMESRWARIEEKILSIYEMLRK